MNAMRTPPRLMTAEGRGKKQLLPSRVSQFAVSAGRLAFDVGEGSLLLLGHWASPAGPESHHRALLDKIALPSSHGCYGIVVASTSSPHASPIRVPFACPFSHSFPPFNFYIPPLLIP